jgi:2-phospho-L-lactate guanylyltransferase (CobY/MobA/RfbA family)
LEFPFLQNEPDVGADIHVFSSTAIACFDGLQFHPQEGASFAQRFESAVETLCASGYDEIVAVGRDCPSLCADDIAHAFAELSENRLVLGPDHRGGCYLIAFRAGNRALIRNVRWNQNTDCAQLRKRGGKGGVSLLPVKHDIDSWADLRILAAGSDWIAELASSFFHFFSITGRIGEVFVDLARHFARVRGQMPPPVSA